MSAPDWQQAWLEQRRRDEIRRGAEAARSRAMNHLLAAMAAMNECDTHRLAEIYALEDELAAQSMPGDAGSIIDIQPPELT